MNWWERRRARKAAEAAVDRCYGVPYASELSLLELHGMDELERRGEVVCDDEGYVAKHWHRNPKGR